MAVNVTSQLSTLDSCESASWTVHNISGSMGSLAAIQVSDEEQPPREGTYCIGWDIDAENGGYYYGFSSTDYSSKIVYVWACVWTAAQLEVLAPGGGSQSGVYIIATDGTNFGYWHVAGKDTYTGGWRCFAADLSRAPDTNSGSAPNLANCTGIGIGFNHLAKSKAAHNAFVDYLRIGDSGSGLKTTTDSSSVADFADIYAGDDSIAVGILRTDNVTFAQGPLNCGDNTSGDFEFLDTGKILLFEAADVPSGHYGITVLANSGGTIKFQLGTKSGDRGIQGCTIEGVIPFSMDFTDTDIDELKLYDTTFRNASTIDLPPNASGREVIDCRFVGCGLVTPDTCVIEFCNFIEADATAVVISSISHNLSDSGFINCPVAIEIDAEGTFPFSNVEMSGCTTDIENSVNAVNEDSYASTNRDGDTSISGGLTNDAVGQAFYCTTGDDLANVEVMLSKSGSPTGNAYAVLYAVTGTPGTDATPTGSALATSDAFDVSTLDGTPTLTRIQFSGDEIYTLSSTTWYFIVIRYEGGDASNYILVGDDTSSPSHSGNAAVQAVSGDAWTAQNGKDLIFYLRTGGIVIVQNTGGSIASHTETGTPPGSTTIENTTAPTARPTPISIPSTRAVRKIAMTLIAGPE